jgi:hypothetical protein
MVQACRGGSEHIHHKRGGEERQHGHHRVARLRGQDRGRRVPSTAHPARKNREVLRKLVTAPPLSLWSLARECMPQAGACCSEGTAGERADQQHNEISGREGASACHVAETRVNDG